MKRERATKLASYRGNSRRTPWPLRQERGRVSPSVWSGMNVKEKFIDGQTYSERLSANVVGLWLFYYYYRLNQNNSGDVLQVSLPM